MRTAPIEPTWGSLQLLGALAPITPTPPGQPTATSTPPGDTLTFQDGLGTYAGATDTYLYRLAPHTNYGALHHDDYVRRHPAGWLLPAREIRPDQCAPTAKYPT